MESMRMPSMTCDSVRSQVRMSISTVSADPEERALRMPSRTMLVGTGFLDSETPWFSDPENVGEE